MACGLIGGFPAANDREQMGQFLRHAFPLSLGSFEELLGSLESDEKGQEIIASRRVSKRRANNRRNRAAIEPL